MVLWAFYTPHLAEACKNSLKLTYHLILHPKAKQSVFGKTCCEHKPDVLRLACCA